MPKCDSDKSNVTNIRHQVFALLDKNPLLTAKTMVKLLELSPDQAKYYQGYLRKLKYDWKCDHTKQQGSIRSVPDDVHNAFFIGELAKEFGLSARSKIVATDFLGSNLRLNGWKPSNAKNRFLLFKNHIGRIRLFENGTVELYVRKPANVGKAMQLFCDGFTKTKWITDLVVLEEFQKSMKIRGFHATFDTGQRLPYMKIPIFKGTNGFQLILGDRTHRHSVELIMEYQEQVEMAKRVIEGIGELIGLNEKDNKPKRLFDDYSS